MRETGKNSVAVKVVYFGLVRNAVKKAEETVELPAGSTVRDLVDVLCGRHGAALRDAILTADGTPGSSVMLLLDGTNILRRSGLDTAIVDDGSLHVLLTTTAMSGG
ncbi:MAG TPA: MoaD/ThiS family protein [candidate division Zixibacteria bacterium]|nr:MoaD/ThiS family protein [candidate division Zixibacteria bacterium]